MDFYQVTIPHTIKLLAKLETWLDKAAALADQKKFKADTLLQARLAPDQYPLVRQIQAACDQAKFSAAKLTGKQPPSHPDTESTFAEIRARIQSVREYLGTFKPEDFAGAAERPCSHVWMQGKALRGRDYWLEMGQPNFFFHYTTAYAILRHNGVDLGKSDYLTDLSFMN
ncbi:MAG TPA: DUF1993 domain-containing protein [Polyangiaceae bacterium]|nr:DUF1993 domain-containing protein [Polyangiaceae bacterium]